MAQYKLKLLVQNNFLNYFDETNICLLKEVNKQLYNLINTYYIIKHDENIRKDKLLEKYCKNNQIMHIKSLMEQYSDLDWDYGLYGACKSGHMNIVNLMIEKGANDWNIGLGKACEGGHMNIVKLMIEKGANYWNLGLYRACEGGHMNIVKLLIKKGANDWNRGLYYACSGGYINIVKLMIEKGANNCKNCRNKKHRNYKKTD